MNPFTLVFSPGQFHSGKAFLDRIVRFLIDTAVLYYVSCCLLLYGVYYRFPAPDPKMHAPLPANFLALYCETYGTFLLYVIVLAALCLLVLRRLALAEDGLVMAGMALLLILDPTFFNNVFYTFSQHLGLGLGVNTFCFVLGMGIYAALVKVGGVPCTRRSAIATTLTALFVYYYPVGLNDGWHEATAAHYFYLLWWMPLVVAILYQKMSFAQEGFESAVFESTRQEAAPLEQTTAALLPETGEKRTGIQAAAGNSSAIPERMRRRFLVANALIVFYIVLSHLSEANYAYDFDFHAEYLAPALLAVGVLLFKLGPVLRLGVQNRPLFAIPALVAAYVSCENTESLWLHLTAGFTLSPFRLGFAAVAFYFFYLWLHFLKTHRHRSWAVTAAAFLLAGISGNSLPEAIFNVFHLHSTPFAFLTVVFTALAIVKKTRLFPVLAGGCLLISILSGMEVRNDSMLVFALQLMAVWIGLVQWHYRRRDRQWIYALLGVLILSLSVTMCIGSTHRLAWTIDYGIVILCLFGAGRLLENNFLSALSMSGTAAAPLYLARNQLLSGATQLRRLANPGVLTTLLAFLMLPLAYFMSVLKKRRLG